MEQWPKVGQEQDLNKAIKSPGLTLSAVTTGDKQAFQS